MDGIEVIVLGTPPNDPASTAAVMFVTMTSGTMMRGGTGLTQAQTTVATKRLLIEPQTAYGL